LLRAAAASLSDVSTETSGSAGDEHGGSGEVRAARRQQRPAGGVERSGGDACTEKESIARRHAVVPCSARAR
jgi:hypothetical protein